MAFLMGEYIFHYPLPQVRVSCLSGTRRWTEPVWQLSDRPRHPFGSLTFELVSYLTLAGRGGSVSRRDHNPKTRKRAHAAWARKFEGKIKPIPSYSSGEGVWGRGASLREAASPPESPNRSLSGREREGGGLSSERPPPSQYPFIVFFPIASIDLDWLGWS